MSAPGRMRQQIAQGAMIHMGWGWWLLLLANVMANGLIAMSRIRELSARLRAEPNVWDVFFLPLTDPFFALLPFGLVFAFLVGSVSVNPLRPWTLLRVGSRRRWWQGQVWLTLICALVYTLAFLSGIALLVTPAFSWGNEWSTVAWANAQVNPFPIIPLNWMMAFTPISLAGIAIAFLMLGAWGIGMLAQVMVVMTQRPLFGFTVVFVVIASAIATHNLGMPLDLQRVFPHMHWVISSRADYSLLWQSVLYWGMWIAGLTLAGAWLSRRMDASA